MNVPDNYELWEAHEARLGKALSERLVCDYCGCHIPEDYYFEINGDIICEECLELHFKKYITD